MKTPVQQGTARWSGRALSMSCKDMRCIDYDRAISCHSSPRLSKGWIDERAHYDC